MQYIGCLHATKAFQNNTLYCDPISYGSLRCREIPKSQNPRSGHKCRNIAEPHVCVMHTPHAHMADMHGLQHCSGPQRGGAHLGAARLHLRHHARVVALIAGDQVRALQHQAHDRRILWQPQVRACVIPVQVLLHVVVHGCAPPCNARLSSAGAVILILAYFKSI